MAVELPPTVRVEIPLGDMGDPAALPRATAKALGVHVDDLPELALLKRSLDCRRGRIRFHHLVALDREGRSAELALPMPRQVTGPARVLIIGDGPAGLFCAYQLARFGIGAIVLDRGKRVQPRRRDLKGLNRRGEVDPDSNYCFGEGGAGTYSDGKLYTRAHKRGDIRDVIEILALHGAPEAILTEARPHIGSNRLPRVVGAMRERLESVGVQFRFGARVVGIRRGRNRAVRGVRLAGGEEIGGDHIVLATGHSARDVFAMLADAGHPLQSKAFALGVRIEHPQAFVNRAQYGKYADHPLLPSASYRLADSRGRQPVFSFCMCPGGFIVPAATEPGGLVVNGMSLSRRDSRYANSGLVVGIEPQDVQDAGFRGPMAGIELQRAVERATFAAGGERLQAPATRVTDFLEGRGSSTVPDSSYIPGLTHADLSPVLDASGLLVAERLRTALRHFDTKMRGYVSSEAVLVGSETRTSSPVRIPRDEALVSPAWPGLYPCGEGAGYAGGIVSAAVDGMRVARSIARALGHSAP